MSSTAKLSSRRVLLIEDCAPDSELAIEVLGKRFQCDFALVTTPESFAEHLVKRPADVIVADSNVPRLDWLTALRMSAMVTPRIPFIVCSGGYPRSLVKEALDKGARSWVCKDQNFLELVQELEYLWSFE